MGKTSAVQGINEGTLKTRGFEYLREHLDEVLAASDVGDLESIKTMLDSYVSPGSLKAEREEVLVAVFVMVTRIAGNAEHAAGLLSKELERKPLPEAGKPYQAVRYNVIRPVLTRFAMGYNLGKKEWLRDGARDLQKALLTIPL